MFVFDDAVVQVLATMAALENNQLPVTNGTEAPD